MLISVMQDPSSEVIESQETISILELLINGGYMIFLKCRAGKYKGTMAHYH